MLELCRTKKNLNYIDEPQIWGGTDTRSATSADRPTYRNEWIGLFNWLRESIFILTRTDSHPFLKDGRTQLHTAGEIIDKKKEYKNWNVF
jgi:hypothetical protein